MPNDAASGALVGWESTTLGKRRILRLQYVTTPPPHKPQDIHRVNFALDEHQATQLGQFLFQIAGQTSPLRKKGLLEKLFG